MAPERSARPPFPGGRHFQGRRFQGTPRRGALRKRQDGGARPARALGLRFLTARFSQRAATGSEFRSAYSLDKLYPPRDGGTASDPASGNGVVSGGVWAEVLGRSRASARSPCSRQGQA